jgi:hypothetical protein
MPPMLDDDTPDRKYWTAYDHFMIEREARAMRREYAYKLLGSWWRAVTSAAVRAWGSILNAASSESRPVPPRA